jgi:hypothetical protein
MFEIFSSLFSQSLVVLALTPKEGADNIRVVAYATLNTIIRAVVLAGFTYGAIRVVATAVSHGSF